MNDKIKDALDVCPFCGASSGTFIINPGREVASAKCSCGAQMAAACVPERYELVSGDIYRKIPKISAFDILCEHWNRRIYRGGGERPDVIVAGTDDRVPPGPEGYGTLAL